MPKFSVVIPACERPETLRRCLHLLTSEAQGIEPSAFEVIVSDDSRSADVKRLIEREFPGVRWTQGPRRGPAANRNHGAKIATGEWIIFTDDDCLPQRNWLRALSRVADTVEPDVLEGRTVCPDWTGHPMEESIENPRGGNLWSCNLALKRDVFATLGGFDEDFRQPAQEDSEFAYRVRSSGARVAFVEDAVVHHPARRLTFAQLWRTTTKIRWFSLFLLKTRPGWTAKPLLPALAETVLERSVNLLRENLEELRRWRQGTARAAFRITWKTVTFPVLLPLILRWEIEFRRTIGRGKGDRGSEILKEVASLP